MLIILFGMLVGLVLGLTGAGGGILAIPALTLGLGWTLAQATPVALLAVGTAAGQLVPIVPAAVLFDLHLGDARLRPDADAGYAAGGTITVTCSRRPAQDFNAFDHLRRHPGRIATGIAFTAPAKAYGVTAGHRFTVNQD